MGVFMRNEGRMETEDIILGKAKYEDWRSIYRNVWSRPETAEYMIWKVTTDEGGARELCCQQPGMAKDEHKL